MEMLEDIHLNPPEDWFYVPANVRARFFAGLLMAGAGLALFSGTWGWVLAEKRLKTKYEALAEKEIAEAKAFYSTLHKKGDLGTPEGAVEALIPEVEAAAEAMIRYQGGPELQEVEVETNIFTESKVSDEWDYAIELPLRTSEEPYILHEDEWSEVQHDYTRETLTYYAGDNTLVDEKDDPILTIDDTVGDANLQRFGHGTEDARTVFVRNERLHIDFEVLKHDGKYAEEILGFEKRSR